MQYNDVTFPFFTGSELTALATDPELDDLLHAAPSADDAEGEGSASTTTIAESA